MVLQREIGRKSLNEFGEFDFGTRAMKVLLMASYILPDILHSSNTLRGSFPMISKKSR